LFRNTRPKTFWESVWNLIGHLLGTAVIFIVFFAIAWGLSYLLAGLDTLHKFPQEILDIIQRIEIWPIYGDAVLCSVVLIAGTVRFCIDLMEARQHE
jgi:hypothetical protein